METPDSPTVEDEVRRRSACDRCHSQKLRCPKREGAETCDRCAKAGAACKYSPFRQKKEADNTKGQHQRVLRKGTAVRTGGGEQGKELNAKKRKRITAPLPGAVDDSIFEFGGSPDAPIEELVFDDSGSGWRINTPIPFSDLFHDTDFGDMSFENPSTYPTLDFNLPPSPLFRDTGDKISNLLHHRTSPIPAAQDLSRGEYGSLARPWSPPPNPTTPQSDFVVSMPAPQLQLCDDSARRQGVSVSQCIEQLSKLSFNLYEHSTTIPPLDIYETIPVGASWEEAVKSRAKDYSTYRVDKAFMFTQELVDVYPVFISLFMQSTRLASTEPSPNPSPAAPAPLDHPTLLLLLSCHLRLTTIYETLLQHMSIVVSTKGMLCTSQDPSFTAPIVRIGNYVPPPTTSVPMQMLLLLHFATSLRDHAVELEERIKEPKAVESMELDGLVRGSVESVRERATGMLGGMHKLRAALMRQGRVV